MTYVNEINGSINPLCGQINCVYKQLTSSQVKNLVGTPITILPAQGAGTFITPIWVVYKLTYGGSNVFTNPQTCTLRPTGGFALFVTTVSWTGFIDQSANFYSSQIVGASATNNVTVENTGIEIFNISGSNITGNAANDNTLEVMFFYAVTTI